MPEQDAAIGLSNAVLAEQLASTFPPLTISELCERAWVGPEAKGFHELSPMAYDFASSVMSIVQCAGVAIEDDREHRNPNGMLQHGRMIASGIVHGDRYEDEPAVISFRGRMMLAVTEIVEAVAGYQRGDKANVAEELADLMIRVADTARVEGIDLEKAIRANFAKNESRPPMYGGKRY